MKTIFLNRYFAPDHSATSQMLTDLAVALAASGREIHVIASRLRYDDAAALLPKAEAVQRVQVHRVWTSRFGRTQLLGRALDYLSFYLSATLRAALLVRRGDVLVAMTDPPLLSIPVAVVARLRGARLVNWLQDVFPEVAAHLGFGFARGPIGRLLRGLRNASLRGAHRNVVLGRLMRDHLLAERVPPETIEIIPNWADGKAIKPIARAANGLRREWGLENKFVVGYSGNMGRAHEFETIVTAASNLKHHPDLVFLFIGGGPQREMVTRAARDRGLANLLFKPYQPRELLDQSLGVADVHLVSLRPELEGLIVPSKFYGIAAAGRPVLFIGAADGEIARDLREHACGMLIAQGDSAALAEAVRTLKTSAERCAQWGTNARALFDAAYAKAIAVPKWERVLTTS